MGNIFGEKDKVTSSNNLDRAGQANEDLGRDDVLQVNYKKSNNFKN